MKAVKMDKYASGCGQVTDRNFENRQSVDMFLTTDFENRRIK